ncbi:MAG: carbamoyltransferase C-terminal domain-containing protein [Candidatus Aenigmatarchaeota archaeon]
MIILGIWDGHDSGACIVENGRIKAAVNEERFTRRKFEPQFPYNSITACLRIMNLKPSDIQHIAYSTSDFSNTLTRLFPTIKEQYYYFKRRKTEKRFFKLKSILQYEIGELRGNFITEFLSDRFFQKKLKRMGFNNFKLYRVEHHLAHVASAYFTSGFKRALCITLDGFGDGISSTVNICNSNEIQRIAFSNAKDSLGVFFSMVTSFLGMRILEDEGKVMCLASYSYPISNEENKLINFFRVDGLQIKANYSISRMYEKLEHIAWNLRREEFACMAQKTLEEHILHLFENAIADTGIKNVCWSGGIASNIRVNQIIRLNSGLKNWFVFPHMGDGGLAVGAALYASYVIEGTKSYRLNDVYLGPKYNEEKIEYELKKHKKLKYEYRSDISNIAGELISQGNYLLWFQGRMEYGPRALGNRSILALASSDEIKNKLNLQVKRREWFQPFCPTILKEDANIFFEDCDTPDPLMTMGFKSKQELYNEMKSVIHIDGSSRPQMLGNENEKYRELIKQIKKNTGYGIVLNTSFNIHGDPIVCNPKDAINTMLKTRTKYMAIENFLVENNS